MAVSRNDPCPCGSGLKYKRCHEGQDVAKPRRSGVWTLALLVLLVAVGAAAVVIGIARSPDISPRRRVWSPEHGHWHEEPAPGRSASERRLDPHAVTPDGLRPVPLGTPPPGKVWSPEHGHWHEAPVPRQPTLLPYDPNSPAMTGTPPPGWIWEPEHRHFHPPVSAETTLKIPVVPPPTLATPAPAPPGTPPPGKVWSPEHEGSENGPIALRGSRARASASSRRPSR
ncbi:MAG TPA: SEC-C domain-containing protein [Thermoanaerobaculia bacterium]